jgi:hypothetical protein
MYTNKHTWNNVYKRQDRQGYEMECHATDKKGFTQKSATTECYAEIDYNGDWPNRREAPRC